jgi:myo-inositol 2-dehydrogenase / D-chiro-inositol 1-dehydrogenase
MTAPQHSTTRRSFLQQSAAVAGAASLASARELSAPAKARSLGSQTINVALIGCGGRGRGAAVQALSTAGDVKLVALADAFSDRLDDALGTIQKQKPEQVDVPEERRFVGFDAYQKAIDVGVDLVILTTPPGFRPIHFEYAVAQGKHVFMEKPVAVDGPGIRRVLAAAEVAREKSLRVGVGLQRHHSRKYQETIRRIHDGAIGDLILLRAYWNSAGVWVRPRQEGMTEMEYQMRNWYYFNWLCGDHITEQHIHNLDVANWAMNAYPASAQGQGGRQVRTGLDHGEIYDHHMVEFTYEGGVKLLSQCRHQRNTWSQVNEFAHGTLGSVNFGSGRIEGPNGWGWRFQGESPDPYQVEHDVLFQAVREGLEHNEAERGAKSTLTSILGRMATYSGKVVTWEQALNSELALVPEAYDWNANPPTLPDAEGRYPIPMPGLTRAL